MDNLSFQACGALGPEGWEEFQNVAIRGRRSHLRHKLKVC
jgi:hypothetical protein